MTHGFVPVCGLEFLPPPLGEGWGGGSTQMDAWRSKITADFKRLEKLSSWRLTTAGPHPSLPPKGEGASPRIRIRPQKLKNSADSRVAFSLGYFTFGEAKAKVTNRQATPGSGTQTNTKFQPASDINSIATHARTCSTKSGVKGRADTATPLPPEAHREL
jgi:hypothetical protein